MAGTRSGPRGQCQLGNVSYEDGPLAGKMLKFLTLFGVISQKLRIKKSSPDKRFFVAFNCDNFLINQSKHVFWLLKRTVSLKCRRFF